jgi:hypothetical protein
VPVRLDPIEEMTRLLNQTLVTRAGRRESGGDPPIPGQLASRSSRSIE